MSRSQVPPSLSWWLLQDLIKTKVWPAIAPPPPGMAELYKYISDYSDRPPPQAGSSTWSRYNNSKEGDKTEQTSRRPLISQCPSQSVRPSTPEQKRKSKLNSWNSIQNQIDEWDWPHPAISTPRKDWSFYFRIAVWPQYQLCLESLQWRKTGAGCCSDLVHSPVG